MYYDTRVVGKQIKRKKRITKSANRERSAGAQAELPVEISLEEREEPTNDKEINIPHVSATPGRSPRQQ